MSSDEMRAAGITSESEPTDPEAQGEINRIEAINDQVRAGIITNDPGRIISALEQFNAASYTTTTRRQRDSQTLRALKCGTPI